MHGAWGALSILIKKQEANKFRKSALRAKLKNQKKGFLNTHMTKDEFDFPELSSMELKILKDQIRKEYGKERIKEITYYIMIMITIITCFYFFFLKS